MSAAIFANKNLNMRDSLERYPTSPEFVEKFVDLLLPKIIKTYSLEQLNWIDIGCGSGVWGNFLHKSGLVLAKLLA